MESFLQSLAETLKEENTSLKEENIALREKLGIAAGGSPVVFDAVHALRDENESLTEENIALGERLREKDIRLAKLEQILRAKDAHVWKLQEDNLAAAEMCRKFKAETSTSKSLAEMLTRENLELRQRRTELERRLRAMDAHMAKSSQEVGEIAFALQRLQERESAEQGDKDTLPVISASWAASHTLPKSATADTSTLR